MKKSIGDTNGALVDFNKDIALKPDHSGSYFDRGLLYYDERKFAEALADFRKAIELDGSKEYSRFRVWLVRARLGEAGPATEELRIYLANRKTGKPDDWESNIMRFLTGQMTEAAFLDAARLIKMKRRTRSNTARRFSI